VCRALYHDVGHCQTNFVAFLPADQGPVQFLRQTHALRFEYGNPPQIDWYQRQNHRLVVEDAIVAKIWTVKDIRDFKATDWPDVEQLRRLNHGQEVYETTRWNAGSLGWRLKGIQTRKRCTL
jgi:hypothetical protein